MLCSFGALLVVTSFALICSISAVHGQMMFESGSFNDHSGSRGSDSSMGLPPGASIHSQSHSGGGGSQWTAPANSDSGASHFVPLPTVEPRFSTATSLTTVYVPTRGPSTSAPTTTYTFPPRTTRAPTLAPGQTASPPAIVAAAPPTAVPTPAPTRAPATQAPQATIPPTTTPTPPAPTPAPGPTPATANPPPAPPSSPPPPSSSSSSGGSNSNSVTLVLTSRGSISKLQALFQERLQVWPAGYTYLQVDDSKAGTKNVTFTFNTANATTLVTMVLQFDGETMNNNNIKTIVPAESDAVSKMTASSNGAAGGPNSGGVPSGGPNVGAIIGGIVAALVIIGVVVFLWKRQRDRAAEASKHDTKMSFDMGEYNSYQQLQESAM